jgi:hypothetical protein
MNELPELLDARKLAAELGVTRAAAEAVMRNLPVVQIEGLRKVYVRRGDVSRYLAAHTFTKGSGAGMKRGVSRVWRRGDSLALVWTEA